MILGAPNMWWSKRSQLAPSKSLTGHQSLHTLHQLPHYKRKRQRLFFNKWKARAICLTNHRPDMNIKLIFICLYIGCFLLFLWSNFKKLISFTKQKRQINNIFTGKSLIQNLNDICICIHIATAWKCIVFVHDWILLSSF